jgi:hypothetical protein
MASQSLNSGSDANDIPSDPTGTGSWDNTNANQSNVLNSDTFTNQFTDAKFSDPACQADINTQGCLPLWDVQVSDLLAVLGDSNLTFLFQMNETGDSGTLLGQDLTAWARVTLSGPGGEVSFTLGGNNPTIPQQQVAQTAGVDDILPTANDTWAHVHSEICVEENPGANFGAVFLGECTASGFVNGVTVNQSLGADQAGFAVISDALNLALRSGLYTVMTVDLREAWLNDGGEQLWIVGTCPPGDTECVSPPPPPVPEPATLALLGVGLAALALRRTKLRRA